MVSLDISTQQKFVIDKFFSNSVVYSYNILQRKDYNTNVKIKQQSLNVAEKIIKNRNFKIHFN